MKRLNKYETGFGTVEIIIVLVILTVVIGIGFYTLHGNSSFNKECNTQYDTALKNAQPQIKELNDIALLGEQPAQKANVQRSGDCIDSRPYVTVNKVYKVNEAGGKAVDTFRLSLKNAGYKITSEDFGSEGCKLHFKVQAQKDNVKIYAVASQTNIKDSTCTDGYPTVVSEAHFRSQNIDYAELRLPN